MSADTPFIEVLRHVDVPAWQAGERVAALDRFLTAGLPSSRLEGWRHTSLAHLERAALHLPSSTAGAASCPDITGHPGHVLVFQDGELVCHGTYLAKQIAGTLQELADTQPVRDHLGRLAADGALTHLNRALWRDGTRLYLPAGSRIGVPVFALYGAAEAEAMLYPRTLAVLEQGSEATLIEHYRGDTAAPYWQNAVTEISLADGARLDHVIVVEEGAAATHTGVSAVRLGQGSRYRALHVGLDGGLVRRDLQIDLTGPDATATVDALDLAGGRRHTDLHLHLRHAAPGGTSRIAYRGLADGHARAVFDGHVQVAHRADGTDARQTCRGLLLSPTAEVDAMPRLEIRADDVRCSHGASLGNLDPDAVFYLQSRAIDADTARQMLLQGFAGEALGLLDETPVRDWLLPRVHAALARATGQEARP